MIPKKALPGDPLTIPADVWNALQEVAADHRAGRLGRRPDSARLPERTVLIRNDSGAAVPQFGVLALGRPLVLPASSEPTFRAERAFAGEAAIAGSTLCILQEPLGRDQIGRAVLEGITPARLSLTNAVHASAECDEGDPSRLASTNAWGPATILWADGDGGEDADGNRWAVVRLHNGGTPPLDIHSYMQPDRWRHDDMIGTWTARDAEVYRRYAGKLYLAPIVISQACRISAIGLRLYRNGMSDTVGGIPMGVDVHVRLGLYRDVGDPNAPTADHTLVVDGGDLTLEYGEGAWHGDDGDRHVTVDTALDPGLYWIAMGLGFGNIQIPDPCPVYLGSTWAVGVVGVPGLFVNSHARPAVRGAPYPGTPFYHDSYYVDYPNTADYKSAQGALPTTVASAHLFGTPIWNVLLVSRPVLSLKVSAVYGSNGRAFGRFGRGGGRIRGDASGAPADLSYVLAGRSSAIATERRPTTSATVTVTDGGPGGNLTLTATGIDDGVWS